MEGKNQRYAPGLDHVRAFAASWIVIYHSFQLISARLVRDDTFDPHKDWISSRNPIVALAEEGHTAVGMFMVLSGFVLARAAIGSDINYWRFLQNRVLRIYPMFLVTILAGLALVQGVQPLDSILMTLLPIGSVEAMARLGPFSNSLWAIPVEFQFYLVFPFLMGMLRKNGPRQLGLILLAAVVMRGLVFAAGGALSYATYFTILGRIDEFLIGMLAAYYVAKRPSTSRWPFLIVVVLNVGILYGYNQVRGYVSDDGWKMLWPTVQGGMWAAFIVTYLPVSQRMWVSASKFLSEVGKVSFSVYLLHFVLVSTVSSSIRADMIVGWDPQFVALLIGGFLILPATVVISRLTYAAIEEPFLNMRVRYLKEVEKTGPYVPSSEIPAPNQNSVSSTFEL